MTTVRAQEESLDRVAEAASRTPDAVAVRDGDRRLTFAELDATADRLARRLAAIGVTPDSRIAVLLERSADHMVAVLAALRAGAVTAPLDPAGTPETTAAKLARASARTVVTRSGLAGMLPAGLTTLLVDEDGPEAEAEPARGSLLLFTAGSTAEPAPVLGTAGALDAMIAGVREAYGVTAGDRAAWLATPGSAAGPAEWLPFLAAGAEVVVAGPAAAASPARLRDWLLAAKATHAALDAERAERLTALRWPASAPLRTLAVRGRLRRADAVPSSASSSASSSVPFSVVAEYGTAETTGPVLIGGRPIPGVRAHVLDEEMRPAETGELYVAGPVLATVYAGDPARTAAAFVRHSLPGEPARLLHRTGDVARRAADGTVEVLGRAIDRPLDHPGLEADVLGQPGVREVAVAGGVCFVVAQSTPRVPEGVPVVELPELPRLADGRPDRRALLALAPKPAPAGLVAHPGDAHLPFPLTDTQQAYWIGRSDAVEFGNVGCHGYWEWESEGLDVERFRRAWAAVVRRHDMLRAVILPDGTQRVLTDLPEHEIPVLDLRSLAPEAAEEEAARLREELSHKVLPADQWPLWDVRLTLLPDGRVRLHLGLDLLIIDAWSYFHILVPDLVTAYDADRPDALAPLDVTFRDYVLATSGDALEASEDYQRSRAYWMKRLDAGLPSAPDLPRAPAGTASTGRFTRRQHRLSAEDWSRLQARGTAASLTPSGIVVAVFAEVLRTWSRNDTFTINFPLFNRLPLHPAINDLIGDFTTTSLLAVEKTDGTFEERARSIQAQLWTDLEHRHFGGVRVMRELARRSGGVVRAAFPVVVTSLLGQPARRFHTSLGAAVHTSTQTPQVTIDFQVSEVEGRLEFSWDSLDEVFPPGMVEDMFGSYCGLLERLAADPSAWREEWFNLVPRHQLEQRERVNRTEADMPELLLHTPVARHAAIRPDAVAVVSGDRRLTYAELDRRVNQVGRVLREAGARPNRLVAVVMEKGWEQIVAAHGVLAAGAAYLPIDPGVPSGRLHALLEDGEVELVLTQSRVDGRLDWPAGPRRLLVDRDFDTADGSPLDPVQRPTDLAYVIYTSGSTGKPKGVMVDHKGAANTILDINERFDVGPDDRCIALSGLHFDLSVYDTFGMVHAGGTVVMPEPYDVPDPAAWAALARDEGVTFWNSVPALIEVLVNHLEGLPDAADVLTSLRLAILAGDWIPVTLPDRLRALARNVRVIGSGGPTETCVWSVIYPIGEVDPDWASIPYGRPMSNQRYHVLDDKLRPRPVWVPGQIHIGSPVGLAHGYWRDPERTAAKFFPMPGTGERVYASGDMGRYLPDGNIEILGREDFQVKIQGYRIELGEIEAVLADHPSVDRAVVVAAGAVRHSRRLVAFVTAAGGETPDPEELQRFAAETLPAYMVPGTVVTLDAMPLTGNGKVDRLALSAMADDAGSTKTTEFVPPSTPLEHAVAWLWSDLLGVAQIGRDDHFFQLGGDSVKATALVGRVRELFGAELGLRTVFAAPTLAQICAALADDPETGEQTLAVAEALQGLTEDDLAVLAEQ
ncbi:amino acid adenylation domain-containing protein [Microbispora sp. RL4-1S]|uniref:Phenyloxazoline synthase MbtB n=1 Tax=Microbispora oryzae TaxID=2806554 RepID=A0A941AP19_9ACTN|nr:non-ribosomal peptide synthetase [Microbispora oryzae]MBP2703244.1 amino acid adenylation domain-containing protein [Microbispora oryzae]